MTKAFQAALPGVDFQKSGGQANGILGKEAEAASCLAQAALWALQVAQHLDWPTFQYTAVTRDSHLVRCEVEEVESLPNSASHCQLRAFTQLLGKSRLHLRNTRSTMNVTWKPEKWTGGRESARVTQEQAAASFAFNRFESDFKERFQIWSHLDSEIGLDSKEARDKETRLH